MELVAEKYKQTEVGVIPCDWEVTKLGMIANIIGGGTPSSFVNSYWNGDINWFTPTEIGKEKYSYQSIRKISKLGFENCSAKMLPVGTIILTTRAGIGDVSILMQEGCTNQGFQSFIVKNEIDNEYLYYLISTLKNIFLQNASGSTFLEISPNKIRAIQIPLPPTKAEQTAIATALSDADALISGLEKLITKKRNIKQGAMQKLLQPKEGWEVKKLGEVAFVNMGQSPLSAYYNSEGIGLPLVQGNADVENRKTIIRFYTSMITKRGKVGDIIMSVRAPVGEISKATFECCLGRGVCSISFDNEYLYHYLIYFEKSWAKLSTGSTFDSVNSKQVKELEIPIPISKKEQENIATILSDMDAEITALETKLEKYRKVKLGMMQNLLTGKIRLV